MSIRQVSLRSLFTLTVMVACFCAGYWVRDRRQPVDEFQAFMDLAGTTIARDEWIESNGNARMVPYEGTITACTVEDIFGSREAYLEMFSTEGDSSEISDDPFDEDPFNTRECLGEPTCGGR